MVTGRFRAFAVAACIGMLLVLLAGALVTNTESGRGCGDDWPLCNGKFIPAYTFESMLEYSHRVVSGLEGLLVLGVTIATYRMYRKDRSRYKEPHYYASAALLFTIVQALMGAAAVMWPQSPPVLAIHFGISLVAFAATMLLVIWTYRAKHGNDTKMFAVAPSIMPRALWTAIYCYVVIYLGAFIRHTDSAGGCEGWPLCNGQVVPELEGATGAVFIHRVAALLLAIAVVGLYVHIKKVSPREAGLANAARWVVILIVAQVLSGALLTETVGDESIFIFTSLLHNLIIVALFSLLIDIVIRSWRFREGRAKA
ncbi:heme A synthase [Paenibacillus nanensis]|uniref:Heme A synthase n=1 Tax=Paenibacillus nanensis TaxID=393251 RepID=A0A3A1V393_9BACL|nr:COX15/CtaA family protein [Paenibacillus nanensis]RIX53043.1 heme A synthase [Paenibacillus nanensis]